MSYLKNSFKKAATIGCYVAAGAVLERYGGLPTQDVVSAAKDFASIGTMVTTGAFIASAALDPVVNRINEAASRFGM